MFTEERGNLFIWCINHWNVTVAVKQDSCYALQWRQMSSSSDVIVMRHNCPHIMSIMLSQILAFWFFVQQLIQANFKEPTLCITVPLWEEYKFNPHKTNDAEHDLCCDVIMDRPVSMVKVLSFNSFYGTFVMDEAIQNNARLWLYRLIMSFG